MDAPDAIWLLRLPTSGTGPRLAVKDCIDVSGTVTTAGSRAVAASAVPARRDAPVVANARAGGARIVGKTNLVELCRRADGLNAWTGTPLNPLDPDRIPGGSSSGSAVAVALGQADVAYGTDTGGSIRVPAACCGIAGLKTTAARIPTNGVVELSRSLDTVGPLAPDVAGLVTGMALLEPGFTVGPRPGRALTAARLRLDEVAADVDAAVDAALAAAGVAVTDVPAISTADWEQWCADADELMIAEAFHAQRQYLEFPNLLEPRHAADIEAGAGISARRVVACRRTAAHARAVLGALLDRFDVLALATLPAPPPRLDEHAPLTRHTVPFNLTGLPAVALPVPPVPHTDPCVTGPAGGIPPSLQLVGRWNDEESLLAAALVVEQALTDRRSSPAVLTAG